MSGALQGQNVVIRGANGLVTGSALDLDGGDLL
jgi:hypothetical protein